MIYICTIKYFGINEYIATKKVTTLRKELINELSYLLLFDEDEILSLRTLQKSLKSLEINDSLKMELFGKNITILKLELR